VSATKYRKKPVEIEAWQIEQAEDIEAIGDWIAENDKNGSHEVSGQLGGEAYLAIRTLEGEMRADVGDWVIRGVQDEFYPCKPDIFAATYERAEDNTQDDIQDDPA
jgi:hypothetical protein